MAATLMSLIFFSMLLMPSDVFALYSPDILSKSNAVLIYTIEKMGWICSAVFGVVKSVHLLISAISPPV